MKQYMVCTRDWIYRDKGNFCNSLFLYYYVFYNVDLIILIIRPFIIVESPSLQSEELTEDIMNLNVNSDSISNQTIETVSSQIFI